MDAARSDSQQLLAVARGEKKALRKRIARLFDEVAPFVLPLLPLDARARAACTRRAWRAAMSWAELDFDNCAVCVTDDVVEDLCSYAGPALRSLRLDARTCENVTVLGVVNALYTSDCAGVQRIYASSFRPSWDEEASLTPTLVVRLAGACPNLEHAAFRISCNSLVEAAQVAAALPGPLTLSIQGDESFERPESVMRALLLRSLTSLELHYCDLTPADMAKARHCVRTMHSLRWLFSATALTTVAQLHSETCFF